MSHYILSIELDCEHDHPLNAIAAIEGMLPDDMQIKLRRHYQSILIKYDNQPLVVVEYKNLMNANHVLKWYAEEYAFDLDKLTYIHLPSTVHCELNDIQLRKYL